MGTVVSNLRLVLASNIKEHRRILGISQEKLAELASLSWQTVNSIECCRTWVSDKTLENLARALKIEPFQLLTPLKTKKPAHLTSDEALRQLYKLKRTFDDTFNEVLNSVK